MDLERNKMKLSLHHPTIQSLPSESQFKIVDLYIDMSSIPLEDKINWNRRAREILYSELSKSALLTSKDEKLLEKVSIGVNKKGPTLEPFTR